MNYLVTAIGSLSAAEVIAALREVPGARIIGCNSHPAEWVATSSMVDAFHQVPPAGEREGFLAALRHVCQVEAIDRVLPLTDPEVDVLNEHRHVFGQGAATLCIPGQGVTRICRDKWRVFRSFEHDPDVACLPTSLLDDHPSPAAPFPLIVKPSNGRSSEGLALARDGADYAYLRERLRGGRYVVQPRLAGDVCVVDVVRQESSGLCSTMARKELLRTSNGAGLTVQMLPAGELNRMARHVARRLQVNGCINIEFLVHEGRAMLMDINPRFSAGVVFSRIAGYDMVKNHLKCFETTPIDPEVEPRPAIYARSYAEFETTTTGT